MVYVFVQGGKYTLTKPLFHKNILLFNLKPSAGWV